VLSAVFDRQFCWSGVIIQLLGVTDSTIGTAESQFESDFVPYNIFLKKTM
jgi:hypothetical protein